MSKATLNKKNIVKNIVVVVATDVATVVIFYAFKKNPDSLDFF